MSIVTIRNVEFLNNLARFLDPYRLRVTFECVAPLEDGAEDLDQELDDCLAGPIPIGTNAFEFEGCLPDRELQGARVCSSGYYQNTKWEAEGGGMPPRTGDVDPDKEKERPLEFDKLVRDINNNPRVTRFQIKWDMPQQPNLASAGATTSVAVPSADEEEDAKDTDAKPNGTNKVS
ncbi:ASF1-like protein [Thelephora ganbajun]|uniref:ASF1-like protein n=1 Tax=Thelephora ganbajun TaxID=370292 RepID=A0ACB6Z607_THEGA|nr:ASF1-like protein [Thelephora ganbajun]